MDDPHLILTRLQPGDVRAIDSPLQGNEVHFTTSRSYTEIARANIFNLFNAFLI